MKKVNCIAAAIGLAIMPWLANAQGPAASQADATPAAVGTTLAIPADQQPTKEQLIRLFDLLRVRDQIESIAKMMPAMMQQQLTTQIKRMQQEHPELAAMTEAQQQTLMKVMDKYIGRLIELYTSDDMISDMVGLYQRHISRADVEGIIAFYSSPAGQHLLDVQPAMLKEYLPLALQRMQDHVRPLTEEMRKEIEEITRSAVTASNSSNTPDGALVQPQVQTVVLSAGDSRKDTQGNGVLNPRVVVTPPPAYTLEARKAGIEGEISLEGIVRKNGTVDSCRILKGLGYGLDESAVDTVTHKWRFEPGTLNGKPVDVVVKINVVFRLFSKADKEKP